MSDAQTAPRSIEVFRKPLPDELRQAGRMTARQAERTTPGSVKAFFEAHLPVLKTLATDFMRPERLLQVAQTAIRQTPRLQECTVSSLFGALVICATMRLEPNTPEGLCYLIPRKKRRPRKDQNGNVMKDGAGKWLWDEWWEVNFQLGYKGRVQLFYRSPHVRAVQTTEVCEHDKRRVIRGTNPRIDHEIPTEGERGDPVGYYATVKLANGETLFEYMSLSEIMAIRDEFSDSFKQADQKRSAALAVLQDPNASAADRRKALRDKEEAEDNPWIRDWKAMARKTTLTPLAPYVPANPELAMADALDRKDALMRGQSMGDVIDHGSLDAINAEDEDEWDNEPDEVGGQTVISHDQTPKTTMESMGLGRESEKAAVVAETKEPNGQPARTSPPLPADAERQQEAPSPSDDDRRTEPETKARLDRWWGPLRLGAQQASLCKQAAERCGILTLQDALDTDQHFWLSRVEGCGRRSAEIIMAALDRARPAGTATGQPETKSTLSAAANLFDQQAFGDPE